MNIKMVNGSTNPDWVGLAETNNFMRRNSLYHIGYRLSFIYIFVKHSSQINKFSQLFFGLLLWYLLHHCVVIFFWSSGIMDCMLFTFENKVPLMRQGASVVLHLSLPLMKSVNKTEAAVFPYRLYFLSAFSFRSLIQIY